MAHKGYTLNYFIDFFSNIPNSRFTEGELLDADGVRMCALGHAGAANRDVEAFAGANTCDVSGLPTEARAQALDNFLNGETASINDGDTGYAELGKTPRGRILRALRNRKRTGNIFGSNE